MIEDCNEFDRPGDIRSACVEDTGIDFECKWLLDFCKGRLENSKQLLAGPWAFGKRLGSITSDDIFTLWLWLLLCSLNRNKNSFWPLELWCAFDSLVDDVNDEARKRSNMLRAQLDLEETESRLLVWLSPCPWTFKGWFED